MLTDLNRAELERYRSDYRAPDDFDDFWRTTLCEQARYPLDVRRARASTPLTLVDVFDVSFAGYAGDPVHAWLRLPKQHSAQLPAVVQFHGYASGRGHAIDDLTWVAAGYAQLVMDTRGQGAGHAPGATGDPHGSGPAAPGFLTRGIENPRAYYYRRVFVDAVRAVHVARSLDEIDARRVAAVGNSQGGGIALAVAGLMPDVAAVYLQAPFLCDIRRATLLTDSEPYAEITRYLRTHRRSVQQVFDTLAYFDGVGFAARAQAPAWFSAGLLDEICPPSTAFGAHAAYAGPKHIRLWDYNGHDAGGSDDLEIVLTAFATAVGGGRPITQHHLPGGTS